MPLNTVNIGNQNDINAAANPATTNVSGGVPAAGTGGLATIPDGTSDIFKLLIQQALTRSSSLPTSGIDKSGVNDLFSGTGGDGIFKVLQGFLNNANTKEGLSDPAKAAMSAEATSGIASRYQDAASNLNTNLMQRGLGGGAIPANAGAILRGFGPLQQGMADAQSKAGRDTVLADEQQKLTSLLANRSLASSAVGMGANLAGANNQFDLSSFGLGNNLLSTAMSGAGGLADLEPTSFKNILLASLLGAGSKAISDPNTFKQILSGLGKVFGLGGGADTGTSGDLSMGAGY